MEIHNKTHVDQIMKLGYVMKKKPCKLYVFWSQNLSSSCIFEKDCKNKRNNYEKSEKRWKKSVPLLETRRGFTRRVSMVEVLSLIHKFSRNPMLATVFLISDGFSFFLLLTIIINRANAIEWIQLQKIAGRFL